MPRYIDADAVKKYILETGFYCDTYADRQYSAEIIDTFPTADVQEVKHGKWKVAMLDHESMGCRPKVHYCSVCNHITTFRTFFCPNCGADMREEKSNAIH